LKAEIGQNACVLPDLFESGKTVLPDESLKAFDRILKRYFITGLLIWVPLGITIWV
jgi:hypothetical protein